MTFPLHRPRRLRQSETWRRVVTETRLTRDGLVYPLFVVPGRSVRRPVESMPASSSSPSTRPSLKRNALRIWVCRRCCCSPPAHKDSRGSAALDPEGLMPRRLPQSSAYARSFSFGPMSACAARPITDTAGTFCPPAR